MSYNPSLVGQNAMALLTGAIDPNGATNASPDTVEPVDTAWLTLPQNATQGVNFSSPVLFRGFPATNQATRARIGDLNNATPIWREASHMTVYTSSTGIGAGMETSEDEVCIFRSSAAEIKVGQQARYVSQTFVGPSWNATYSRFCAWRMG